MEITGKDALEVLQKIYISDISKVAVGRSKYTASLDENGEVIDDVIVMHMADGLYWVSDLYGPRLLPWIEQHKGGADIHAKIITYDWDMYAVQGPDSLKAMNAMLDAPVGCGNKHCRVVAERRDVYNLPKQGWLDHMQQPVDPIHDTPRERMVKEGQCLRNGQYTQNFGEETSLEKAYHWVAQMGWGLIHPVPMMAIKRYGARRR